MKMILFTRKLNISTVKLRIKMIHFKALTIAVHEFYKFCISMKKKKKRKVAFWLLNVKGLTAVTL